ncbi:MAG: ABC transporter, partial [Rhodobacterales bacterium]
MARQPTPSSEDREKSKRLGALAALWPFVRPYRGMMVLAIIALTATAAVSLVLPLAVRQVVDNFNVEDSNVLDQFFAFAIIIVALLAFGTGMRYALVTRLGERVVTD